MGGFLGILLIVAFIMAFMSGSLGDGFKFAGILGILIVVIYFIASSSNQLAALFLALGAFWLIYYLIDRKSKS